MFEEAAESLPKSCMNHTPWQTRHESLCKFLNANTISSWWVCTFFVFNASSGFDGLSSSREQEITL